MPKEPDNAVEDLPAPKTVSAGGSRTGMIPVIMTIIAIPLIMVLMWEFYMMPSLRKLALEQSGAVPEVVEDPAAEEKPAAEGEAAAGESGTYEFKDIVANLSGAQRSRYIKVSFMLEGRAAGFQEMMKSNEPKIRDAVLAVLSELTIQDLDEPGVKNILRNNIINSIGSTLRNNAVEQLYFTDFVIH
jgi:flagellar FliL protein